MNNRTAILIRAARGPILLITIGVLFALQQADILHFDRTWPLLIIVIGVMTLLERTAGPRGAQVQPPPYSAPYPGTYPQQPPPPSAGGNPR